MEFKMDLIKSKLSSIGAFFAAAGAFSIILNILYVFNIANFEVRILMWIDSWGTTIGWAIRIGITIAGAALYLIFSHSEEAAE